MDVWSESKQTFCVSFCGSDAGGPGGGLQLNLRGAGGEEKRRAVIIRVITVINKRR